MSIWTRGAVIAAMSFALAPAAHAQAPKFAYINSQKILAEAPGRAEAEATYNNEMGNAKQQLQKMDDSLKTLMTAYEKDAPGLDSARRGAREQIIRDREAEFSQKANDLNGQMQQRQAELARPLMDQVSRVLDEVRTQGGYAMIFDVGAQSNVVVSADKSLDITEQVLTRLKALGPPKTTAAGAPATAPAASKAGPAQKPSGVTRPKP